MRNACAQLITRLPDSRVSKSPPIGLSYAGHEFDRSGREREARIVFAFTQASPSSNPDPLRGATSVRKEFSSLAALFRPWTEFSSNRGVHRLGKSSSEHLPMSPVRTARKCPVRMRPHSLSLASASFGVAFLDPQPSIIGSPPGRRNCARWLTSAAFWSGF